MVKIADQIKSDLPLDFSSTESAKSATLRMLEHIKSFQFRIKKQIEDNYVEFMPNHSTSDMFIEEGEALLRETEHLLNNASSDGRLALIEAHVEIRQCICDLREVSLGLKISHRILKIDDLFQCVDDSNAKKDYLSVLDLLGKLKVLICSENSTEVDRLFQKCDCFDAVNVKYHIQANILQQNLQLKFNRLVQFSEKKFASTKNVTLLMSTDVEELQDTVMALFQARYNPSKLCDFLVDNCLKPMVTMPVSLEHSEENSEYTQLTISYSMQSLNKNLRPSYKQVFKHIKLLLDWLGNINVNVSGNQNVFGVIGCLVKERLLKMLVQDCLMYAVPETMDEYQESTLPDDVVQFEKMLADKFFIVPAQDKNLSEFVLNYDDMFRQRFTAKILENARAIMQKDLQDMVSVAECNAEKDVERSSFHFPTCMVSKSTLELVKLMERVLCQPVERFQRIDNEEPNRYLDIIPIVLNSYCSDVPKIHEKLLISIPQQAALFYNNCMFLAHWTANSSEMRISMHPTLVKILQATGSKTFRSQEMHQQKIISEILIELDIYDTHSIGSEPLKLIRQCLRQMDLLKNVWLNVLPDSIYTITFCNMLAEFCQDIIKRILSLEDISATVANELSELIQVILSKAPEFFKDKHDILQVHCWTRLQQLKLILCASLQEITEQWCDGVGILTAHYTAEEIRRLIRALFQNTDRRAKALSKII